MPIILSTHLLVAGSPEASEPGNSRPWSPKTAPDSAPVKPARVRIVDFGHDFLRDGDGRPRHQFAVHRYRLVKDPSTGLNVPNDDVVKQDADAEVDGDPRTNDVVGYMQYSMDYPFSPVAPWYDRLAGTPRWYGAASLFQANSHQAKFTENGVNHEHDGPNHYPRDNWALFHEIYELYSPYRLAAIWVWQKHDFLNGGADHRVTFHQRSELALYLQRYFMGVEGVRFLVRDGEQYYLSDEIFRGAGQVPGSGGGKQHVLRPRQAGWAKYTPRSPDDVRFDAAGAEFSQHEFQDVTGVGLYVYKDRLISSYFGYKWYAFEADALVHRRQRPSESIDMARVEGPANQEAGTDVPDSYISTCEVPYELFKNVFRLARSNTFVRDPRGFIFDKDGDMGSMDYWGMEGFEPAPAHAPDEPVTDVTYYDAVLFCNAFSEMAPV